MDHILSDSQSCGHTHSRHTHHRNSGTCFLAAILTLLPVGCCWANGGYVDITSPGAVIAFAVYEILVVLLEGLAFGRFFKLKAMTALQISFGANLLSFTSGAAIQYFLIPSDPHGALGAILVYWLFLALLVNIVTEGIVWSVGRSGEFKFWGKIIGVNAVTWFCGIILLASGSRPATRSKESRVKNDIRSLATGLEAYFIDNNSYPLMVPMTELYPEHREELVKMGGAKLHTIYPGSADRAGVTTPISYITSVFPDPFAPRGTGFAYYTNGPGWILFSPGKDRLYEIVPEVDYDSSATRPSLISKTYDPTNGAVSGGDIWRVRQ